MSAVVQRAIAMHLAKQHRLRQTRRHPVIPDAPQPDIEAIPDDSIETPDQYLAVFRLAGGTCAWTYTMGPGVNRPIR